MDPAMATSVGKFIGASIVVVLPALVGSVVSRRFESGAVGISLGTFAGAVVTAGFSFIILWVL